MSDDDDKNAQDECQSPCDPQVGCPYCSDYWQRMRDEGYWVDGRGWTDKAFREMTK